MEIKYSKDAVKALQRMDKVIAWDPDFTKLTPDEEAALAHAETQIANGEFVSESEIDWNA